MSYIRTKDGRIIDTTKYPEHPASWSVQASDYALTIKESENLEELCDCYVLEFDNGNRVVIDADEYCNYEKHVRKNCYGAIWTNKGLIYVAKMDNEGKLVLI